MTDIAWQDPAPAKKTKEFGQDFAAELRKNPGRWALYRPDAPHASFGHTTAKRFGFERTSRSNVDRTYSIYMRAPERAS